MRISTDYASSMTVGQLAAHNGAAVIEHPTTPSVALTMLAERLPAGVIAFQVYADVPDEADCRVAELCGIGPDAELLEALAQLERSKGPCSSWPTLDEVTSRADVPITT